MKRNLLVGFVVALVLALGLVAFAADSLPASKATAQSFGYAILDYTAPSSNSTGGVDWTKVMETTLKTSNQKDLFIDVSLQSSLFTKTSVKSQDMLKDTSVARAGVMVQVLVDGKPASPGQVIFNDRAQTLSATLQGEVKLVDKNGNGYIEEGELAVVAPEEIELILDTTSANAFNFIITDLQAGVHTITVQAKIDTMTSAQSGVAEAKALIGMGSVTVEEVRMIKDLQVELVSP